jgi:hypothetical protein
MVGFDDDEDPLPGLTAGYFEGVEDEEGEPEEADDRTQSSIRRVPVLTPCTDALWHSPDATEANNQWKKEIGTADGAELVTLLAAVSPGLHAELCAVVVLRGYLEQSTDELRGKAVLELGSGLRPYRDQLRASGSRKSCAHRCFYCAFTHRKRGCQFAWGRGGGREWLLRS